MNTDMIIKELPRIKNDPLPKTTILLTDNEIRKRDDVIRLLTKDLNFYTGARVRANDNQDFARDGYARVVGVATSYKAWLGTQKEEDVTWTDNPMLVAARYEDNGKMVNATTNYFRMA